MQAPRWVLIWRSQGKKKKIGCRCRSTRELGFNLAYDRLIFNGLPVVYMYYMGHVKKTKIPTAVL
jgi:hypothetical protein